MCQVDIDCQHIYYVAPGGFKFTILLTLLARPWKQFFRNVPLQKLGKSPGWGSESLEKEPKFFHILPSALWRSLSVSVILHSREGGVLALYGSVLWNETRLVFHQNTFCKVQLPQMEIVTIEPLVKLEDPRPVLGTVSDTECSSLHCPSSLLRTPSSQAVRRVLHMYAGASLLWRAKTFNKEQYNMSHGN